MKTPSEIIRNFQGTTMDSFACALLKEQIESYASLKVKEERERICRTIKYTFFDALGYLGGDLIEDEDLEMAEKIKEAILNQKESER